MYSGCGALDHQRSEAGVHAERATTPLGDATLNTGPVHRESERLDGVAGADALAEREERYPHHGAGLERRRGVVGRHDVVPLED